jgi:hypothetical protein
MNGDKSYREHSQRPVDFLFISVINFKKPDLQLVKLHSLASTILKYKFLNEKCIEMLFVAVCIHESLNTAAKFVNHYRDVGLSKNNFNRLILFKKVSQPWSILMK